MISFTFFRRVLETLDLHNNKIGDEGAAALGEALRGNAVLKNINLLSNNITVEGAAPLLKLFSERRHMESLCGVTPDQTEANFVGWRLGDADAMLIGVELEFNAVMTDLNLLGNDIGPEGAKAIGKALSVNEVLKTLYLTANEIGDEGAVAIADALRVNEVLKTIDLKGNSLGTEGWCAIFAALRDNKKNKIESWDLNYQGINAEIAKVLAEYVSGSAVLTDLNLSGNGIGDEGAKRRSARRWQSTGC